MAEPLGVFLWKWSKHVAEPLGIDLVSKWIRRCGRTTYDGFNFSYRI